MNPGLDATSQPPAAGEWGGTPPATPARGAEGASPADSAPGGVPSFQRNFAFGVALFLALTGGVKLAAVLQESRLLGAADPLLPWLTTRQMLFLAVGLELGVGGILLRHRDARWVPGLILWLVAVFGAYRLGLWSVGFQGHCSCLGPVFDFAPGASSWINRIMTTSLAVMVLGSLSCIMGMKRRPGFEHHRKHRSGLIIPLIMLSCMRSAAVQATQGVRVETIQQHSGQIPGQQQQSAASMAFPPEPTAQRVLAAEVPHAGQFGVEGMMEYHDAEGNVLRRTSFCMTVSNGCWRIKLTASDPSAIFKEVDLGGNGSEIYLVSQDWNGGRLAQIIASKVPYPGSLEEHAVLWAVYVLPFIGGQHRLAAVENPFSKRLPRPLANFTLHEPGQSRLLFEFRPSDGNVSASSPMIGDASLSGRCIVHDYLTVPEVAHLPKLFEVQMGSGQPVMGGLFDMKYVGNVTNVFRSPLGEPMLPPMPQDEVLTFFDTRQGGFANPLIIGAFRAEGKWPVLAELKNYPEYRRWLAGSFPRPVESWIGRIVFVFVLLFPAILFWWLKSVNKTTISRKELP